MLHFSTVNDAFQLPGRNSVVVVPGFLRRNTHRAIKVGEPVVLETPDGTTFHTLIGGIEMVSPPNPDSIPIMLGPGITKEMVPVGTKLWAADVVPDGVV